MRELKETRDMSVSEIKLTLAIEDASVREQKEYMGIEVRCSHTTLIQAEASQRPLAEPYSHEHDCYYTPIQATHAWL